MKDKKKEYTNEDLIEIFGLDDAEIELVQERGVNPWELAHDDDDYDDDDFDD